MADSIIVNFRAPRDHKRALEMIAADMETDASAILRKHLAKFIREYKGGVFFDLAARDSVQIGSGNERA